MAVPKIDEAINDFSAGELDPDVKRSGSPLIKIGGRQMLNWRTLNSHKKANRPGRSALFFAAGRTEKIAMPGGTIFYLNFFTNTLRIWDANGNIVFSDPTYAWTATTLGGIVWAQIGYAIYVAFPDGAPFNIPSVLTWDGVSTWTVAEYTPTISPGGQKRTLFYRISPPNITLQPGATVGSVSIAFSGNVLVAGMVGTRLRFCGRQLIITAVSNALNGTASVIEPLPPAQNLTLSSPVGTFNNGDEVLGSISGAQGIVTASPATQVLYGIGAGPPSFNIGDSVTGGTSGATGTVILVEFAGAFVPYIVVHLATGTVFTSGEVVTDTSTGQTFHCSTSGSSSTVMTVQILATSGFIHTFTTSDLVVGPSGSSAISAVGTIQPQPVAVWDDEVMNVFRGFPASVFADQSRLGFANFPATSVPSGLAWSALGLYSDFYPGAQPDDAIFELAPNDSTVLYVIPGMESSEFVFTDKAIYYIPIGGIVGKPLEPGSVSFNKLSDFGILPGVQPRRADQSIIYVKAGGVTIGAVQAPGAYYRPYVVDSISEMHSHLFTASNPTAIAIPSGPTQFEELYLYIALTNGTLVCGRYIMRNGLIEPGPEGKPTIGWLPWSGTSALTWISANQGDVFFTGTYGGVSVVEKLDNTQYLDGALFVNNLPAAFAPPGGKGPLYNFPGPNSTVFLIDQGTRFMGSYQVDGNGFLVPQFIGGENLSSSQLVAGQPWTAVFEPFMPHAPPGPDNQQRTRKRKVAKGRVNVQNSTGFVFGTRRIPAYFIGEDATQPAPLREDSYLIRPLGRTYDPRLVLTKDTPGPLVVVEYGFEVTV